MAKGSKTVVLDGHTYLITHWSASKGLKIMARLTKIVRRVCYASYWWRKADE